MCQRNFLSQRENTPVSCTGYCNSILMYSILITEIVIPFTQYHVHVFHACGYGTERTMPFCIFCLNENNNNNSFVAFLCHVTCDNQDERCNSQKYTYLRNYTPGIFSRTKISQKHTGGMFLHQAIRNG